jgi:AAA family ATP:ADP antiporter
MQGFSATERFLSLFTTLRPREGEGALILSIQAFLLMFAYYMLKVIRDPLILAEGDPELKAYTNAIQAMALMVVVPVFAHVYHRMGHRQEKHLLMSHMQLFFVANLLLFALAYANGLLIGIVFYIWLGIFSVMLLALFWAFAADLYNVRSGQRIFPLVAAAGSGGSWLGAKFAGLWDPVVGHDGVLLTAALILLVPWWSYQYIDGKIPPGSRSIIKDEFYPGKVPLSEGFMVVFRSYYLTMIALLVITMNLINSNGEYILSSFVTREADSLLASGTLETSRDEFITRFYSNYVSWFTLLGFTIQLFVVSRVFKLIGAGGAILVLPLLMLIGYSFILVFPILAAVRGAMIAENGVSYSLQNTARHALYLPVHRDEKYIGKQCIDTFFFRSGDVLSAAAVFIGSAVLGLGLTHFVLTNLILAAVLLLLSVIIGRRNRKVIDTNISNLPPIVGTPLADLNIAAGNTTRLVIDEDAFVDPDEGDALRYLAFTGERAVLPSWIRFDPLRRQFSFKPPAGLQTSVQIRVVARDSSGLEASSSFCLRSE